MPEDETINLRLDNQEQVIERLMRRMEALEAWATQLKQPKQTLGAGIGQAIPKHRENVR